MKSESHVGDGSVSDFVRSMHATRLAYNKKKINRDLKNEVGLMNITRKKLWIPGLLVLLLGVLAFVMLTGKSDIERIRSLGGVIEFKDLNPSLQVVGVFLAEKEIGDDDLRYIQNFPELQMLKLPGTAISDAGLPMLQKFSELNELVLNGTRISDDGLERLASLSNLSKLRLQRTKITGQKLSVLEPLKKLKELDISFTPVNDAGLAQLRNFKQLEVLLLNSNKNITDEGLSNLAGLNKVRMLGLSDMNISDQGLANIRGMSGLKILFLNSARLTDSGLDALRSFPDMEILYLNRTKVSDKCFTVLQDLKRLKWIELVETRVTEEAAAKFYASHPHIHIQLDEGRGD